MQGNIPVAPRERYKKSEIRLPIFGTHLGVTSCIKAIADFLETNGKYLMQHKHKWDSSDLSQAMLAAIEQSADHRCLSRNKDKINFNGFWRNGNRPNVCAWLDKATWSDAKTGQGGGCKTFADVAFNLSLPQFMHKFGNASKNKNSVYGERLDLVSAFAGKAPPALTIPVNDIWQELCRRDNTRVDRAAQWLADTRGFESPRTWIGPGFANLMQEDLELFEPQHQKLIEHRLALSPQLVAPLRGVHSERVNNLFFRAIGDVPKDEKSRLLTGAGGWKEPDDSPRAFGFPHLIKDFPNIVLCEGMADYFAAEVLLADNEKWLPIGASNADSLKKWALWLSKSKYSGRVTIVYQPDPDDEGEFGTEMVGPKKAVEAMRVLYENNINARFFNWTLYLKHTTTHPDRVADLADSLKLDHELKEAGGGHLNCCFEIALRWDGED